MWNATKIYKINDTIQKKTVIYYSVYKQKGKVKSKNMRCWEELRDFSLFVPVLASIASTGTELGLKLLLCLESRVRLFDKTGFGFGHFLLHPRGGRHHVSIDAGLLLIATTHGPRAETHQDVTSIWAFTSQWRSPIDLHNEKNSSYFKPKSFAI